MTTPQAAEAAAFLAGIGFVTWQFRWLLGAYRTERDRRAPGQQSSRLLLLALALTVFIGLAAITNLYIARRIAVGGLLVLGLIEAVRRRWVK